ncbi:DUF5123 domain-containing protein, partial [Prevotella sp. tf2-5]|uniref:DUF5123 domain-containing protein n=1 Tax=Prevotella sp. tf2-5 TaxID=1761889 RepID=UPI0008EC0778
GQWHNGGRIAQKASLMDVDIENNIWVDCATEGSGILRRILAGKNTDNLKSAVVNNNTWILNGTAEDATSYNKTEGVDIATAPVFADAANGDFTLGDCAQYTAQTGDPRWIEEEPAKFYIIGDMNDWSLTSMTEMTFNAETQAYEYEYAPATAAAFAFSDVATSESWDDFNANHRYAIGEGDQDAKLNETVDLKKVNGAILLAAGTYKISVAKDKSTVTITGEVTPPTPVTVDKLYIMGTGTPKEWGGTTELTFNETTQAFEYEATVTTEDTYLTFGDAEFTSWSDFNGKHRYAPGEGNTEAVVDAEVQLVLVNDGNVLLKTPGTYKISVTKDLKMTITTGGTGINSIYVDGVSGDIFSDGKPVYNLSGQRVFKGYKGVVIKNGKKIVVK